MMQPRYKSEVPSSTATEDSLKALSRRSRLSQKPQPLRASAIGTIGSSREEETPINSNFAMIGQVLSAAALVTGSTVGAGMLILPSLAAGPGFAISSTLFLAIYVVVLTSGLVIADIAINQHEISGNDVPSSFQEFAAATLDSNQAWMANCVSVIPVIVNSLVMIFDVVKAGEFGSSLLESSATGTAGPLASLLPLVDSVDPAMVSVAFLGFLGICLTTLTGSKLSSVASLCVSALLVAFGGLLLPGLAAVQDPMGTLLAPGTAGDEWMASVTTAAPIVLTALQFQNVVPSITKILKYDRTKTVTAITLGSFLPLAMYVAWCYAVLGGGIDTSGVAGPLFTVFSAATLFGSSIGAAMSVTEEVETFVASSDDEVETDSKPPQLQLQEAGETETPKKADVFSLPAVMLALSVPLVGVMVCSDGTHDPSVALGIAGSFGSPILYGVIPAMMAMSQRKKILSSDGADELAQPLVPGGLAGIGALGIAAAVYVGGGLAHQVTGILSVAS